MIRFITRISDWAYRNATPRNILFLLLLILVMNLFVFPHYSAHIVPEDGPALLDLHFGFSAEEAYNTLSAFGEEGRSMYFEMLALADMAYPLFYGLFLILLASFFLKRIMAADNEFRVVNLLAVDAILFDFFENFGIMYMISHFPVRIDFIAGMTSVFNMLKWIMVVLAILLVLVSVTLFLMRSKKTLKHQNP